MIRYTIFTASLTYFIVFILAWHECDKSLPRYYGTGSKLDLLVDELIAFQKDMLDKSTEGKYKTLIACLQIIG